MTDSGITEKDVTEKINRVDGLFAMSRENIVECFRLWEEDNKVFGEQEYTNPKELAEARADTFIDYIVHEGTRNAAPPGVVDDERGEG